MRKLRDAGSNGLQGEYRKSSSVDKLQYLHGQASACTILFLRTISSELVKHKES